jgi:hypothetical protein
VYDKATYFSNVGYVPHAKQWLYHNSRARFRLANCGRRFGKSTMAGRDLSLRLFEADRIFWIVGPTYDLGEKEFRVIWDDLIVKQKLGKSKRVKKAYNKKQGSMWIEFPWKTRLEVRSADHPENLVGEALDHVIMSEAAKHREDTWERFIRPALADRRGSADFPTTPEGYNWLWSIWMMGKDDAFPEYESWKFPSWDNKTVYPGGRQDPEILLLERTMSPEAFAQEIGADFGAFVGKIYPEWDVEQHVRNVPFIPALPNYIAFDWGYTNPLAAIEFQVTPDDKVRIWREHYKSYTTLPEHINILKNREQPEGYHLDMAFGDAADPEAAITVSISLVPCLAMPQAKENWREGIDLVRGFMKERPSSLVIDEFGTPAPGEVALTVDFSCKNTIHEFNNYKAPGSIKGRNVPEMSNKVEDHSMDAIRYGLVHIFKFGAGSSSLAEVYGTDAGTSSSAGNSGGFVTNTSAGHESCSEEAGFFTNSGVF